MALGHLLTIDDRTMLVVGRMKSLLCPRPCSASSLRGLGCTVEPDADAQWVRSEVPR